MTREQELIEEAKKRGYTHDNFKCLRDLKQEGDPNLDEWYYEKSTDILFTNSCGNGGKAVYKEGVWAEIIKPIETFTPVAMKCTQKQFDAIKPKLKGIRVRDTRTFVDYNYLVNNLWGEIRLIDFVRENAKENHNRVVHEEWNEEIFLKACGIEVETLQPIEKEIDLSMCRILVDNAEQSKKLQELAFELGYSWSLMRKTITNTHARVLYFNSEDYRITFSDLDHDDSEFKTFHFNDLFKEETLQEKEQRLLKELEEVRKEIEDSKIKVGDWAVVKSLGMVYKRLSDVSAHKNEVKLTNPELIKLLEQEMN